MTDQLTTTEDNGEADGGALRREDLSPDQAYAIAVRLAAVGVSDQALLTLIDADDLTGVRKEAGLSPEELDAA